VTVNKRFFVVKYKTTGFVA